MSDTDDDVTAVTGPETPDDAPEATANEPAGAPAFDPDEPAVGFQPRYRSVSDKTRALFKAAADSMKKQLDDGAGADDLEPAIAAPTATGAPAQPAATPTAPQGSPPSPTPPPAPALSVDTRQAVTLEAREKALAEREAALVQREEVASARDSRRDKYLDDPAAAIADLVKEWTGIDSDAELREEMADLLTHISARSLGLTVPDDIKARTDSRKATRQVRAWKSDQARREAEQTKKQQAEQAAATEKQRDALALDHLKQFLPTIKDDKGKHPYPFLMAEDAPHTVVWDVIKEQHRQAGSPKEWQPNIDAALKLANDYLKSEAERYFDKRRHLLTPAPAQAAPAVGSAPQGDRQGQRSSTLTNRTDAPVAPAPASEELTGEERRRRSIAKMRDANGARPT